MKKIITMYLLLITGLSVFAQGIPDPLNEQSSTSIGFVQNAGQVTDESDNVINSNTIYYHSIRALPLSYYFDSKFSFVFPQIDQDTITIDTLRRLDITWKYSDVGNSIEPNAFEETDELVNFYYEHCTTGCDQLNKYKGILYESIYSGIDMRVYSNSNWMKIYLVVEPGIDPEVIHLSFDGQNNISVSDHLITLTMGSYNMELPSGIAYEYNAGGVTLLPWLPKFILMPDGSIKVSTNGNSYNNTKTLVYEIFAPVLGKTNDNKNMNKSIFPAIGDAFWDIDTDGSGNAYVNGYSFLFRPKIPITNNLSTFAAKSDIVVTKFNQSDLSVAWLTYCGGSENDGYFNWYGISLDNNGNSFISAPTESDNIPLYQVSGGHWDDVNTSAKNISRDQYLARLNTGGQINWATYFGGYESENVIPKSGDIIVDKTDNSIYLGGTDILRNADIIDPTGNYFLDNNGVCYVARFNPNLSLDWCTYFGDDDASNGAQTHINGLDFKDGWLYMTGETGLFDDAFNFSSGISYNTSFNGGTRDAFITRTDLDFKIDWSTYLGGSWQDYGNRIHLNSNGSIVVGGNTTSTNFPNTIELVSGATVFNDNSYNGGSAGIYLGDAFVSTFSSSLELLNSTYLGGNVGGEQVFGVTSNTNTNDLYVMGATESTNIPAPTTQADWLYEASSHPQTTFPYGMGFVPDGFITGFNPNFEIKWSTYLGGSKDDIIYSSKYTEPYVYAVGKSNSLDFPTNPYQSNIQGSGYITRFDMKNWSLGNKENSNVKNEFNLYPNPTNNILYINFESTYYNDKVNSIYIFNYLGQIERKIKIEKQETIKIDIENLPPGIYILDLIFEGNSKQSKKFVKL